MRFLNIFVLLQGFIAFVAFIDLGTALRGYVERRNFMTNDDLTDIKLVEGEERDFLIICIKIMIFRVRECKF